MDHSVIRLTHCQKEIFCFSVPEECPSCGKELRGSRLQEAPVSLPSPFHNGHKSSCCLLVAPAQDNVSRCTHTHTGRYTQQVIGLTGLNQSHLGLNQCVSCLLLREFDGTSGLHTGISNTTGRTWRSKVSWFHCTVKRHMMVLYLSGLTAVFQTSKHMTTRMNQS